MAGNRIARVRWYLGQTLVPDHFRAQDQSIVAELRATEKLSGYPTAGVAQLDWNPELLVSGTVSLTSLVCVFPDGTLVDLPGNAACGPLSLEETGRTRATVYLHLTKGIHGAEGNRLYEDDPDTLQREIHELRLSTESVVENLAGTFRLGDLEKDVAGRWRADERFIPPLLSVGGHPFLLPIRARVTRVLEWFEVRLRAQHVDSYASRDRLSTVRRTFAAVRLVRARLDDLDRGVDLRPYDFFASLRSLHADLCLLDEVLPEELPPYEHENPRACFEPLLEAMERRVSPTADVSHHESFGRFGDLLRVRPLPDEVQNAGEVYLLVQKESVGEMPSLSGVKIASPSRLATVQQLVLTGVPHHHVPVPPFRHPFGPNIDFHALSFGEEWDYALRENGVVLSAPPALLDTKFALFWRST